MTALPEVAAGLFGRFRRTEEQEQEVIDGRHRSGRDLEHLRIRIGIAAARLSAEQHELTDEIGMTQGQFLRYHPPEREPNDVDPGKTERADHLCRVIPPYPR